MPHESGEAADIFANLRAIADTLHGMFGRASEIAVHDLRDLDHSLVYLRGNLTGRAVGSPITDLVVHALRAEANDAKDLIGYRTVTKDGVVLKSSTTFIRNRRGAIIAAFCLNLDVGTLRPAVDILADFLAFEDSCAMPIRETFAATVHESVAKALGEVIETLAQPLDQLSTEQRLEIVRMLEEDGLFLIRGAVGEVAEALNISTSSIYYYLKKVKSSKRQPLSRIRKRA